MKTHIDLRSTIGNSSWLQRGAAALLATAALTFSFNSALRPTTHAPMASPPIRQAAPATHHSNVPISNVASVYDGGVYVPLRGASLNTPVIGTSSAYDGGMYGTVQHVSR